MLLYVDDWTEVHTKKKTRSDGHRYSTKHTADKPTDILEHHLTTYVW